MGWDGEGELIGQEKDQKLSQNLAFRWFKKKKLDKRSSTKCWSRQSNLTSNQKQTRVRHEDARVSREASEAEPFTGLFQEFDKQSSKWSV